MELKIKTAKELEAAITPDIVARGKAVFMALAWDATVRPVVEGYQRRILEEEKYSYAEKQFDRRGVSPADYIKEPKDAWLMADTEFQHYHKRCDDERIKAGLTIKAPGNCPLLEAEELTRLAKRALVDALEPKLGIGFNDIFGAPNALKNYADYVELCLDMVAPKVQKLKQAI